jgi:hypothetical protein
VTSVKGQKREAKSKNGDFLFIPSTDSWKEYRSSHTRGSNCDNEEIAQAKVVVNGKTLYQCKHRKETCSCSILLFPSLTDSYRRKTVYLSCVF